MIIYKKESDLRKWIEGQREKGTIIGFVPTMGALHQGHLSLLKTSKENDHITISSIFVNPVQFNDPKDYEKYPVTIEEDISLLEENDCSLLFLPSVNEIYPQGTQRIRNYDLGNLENILEGKFRPGHFQGVCAVVHRLLDIVNPDNLYLGQKDYQQCMVIRQLIKLVGLDGKVTINICPTHRDPDGLAMSSRNKRLSPSERNLAPEIYRTLKWLAENIKTGDVNALKQKGFDNLNEEGFRPDYVEIADARNLETVHSWDGKQQIVGLVAAYLNEIRLIDNLILN